MGSLLRRTPTAAESISARSASPLLKAL